VFALLTDLGCIIIDEEQEPTYKSESDPRYHAREVAKYRAAQDNCLLVLGSATPSVESYHAAREGKYHLLSLPQRYQNTPLPTTILADMRGQLREGDPSRISRQLLEELQLNLDRGEQSILFINRRGSARMAACVDCGHIPLCENCSVALTYHSRNGRLMCHHCGYSRPMPETCPECGGSHLKLIGSGTQSIEDELQQLLPDHRETLREVQEAAGEMETSLKECTELREEYAVWFDLDRRPLDAWLKAIEMPEYTNLKEVLNLKESRRVTVLTKQITSALQELDRLLAACTAAIRKDQKDIERKANGR
jgi:primosomal protein N' (replication factor Y)